jgi:hypothetical protein
MHVEKPKKTTDYVERHTPDKSFPLISIFSFISGRWEMQEEYRRSAT